MIFDRWREKRNQKIEEKLEDQRKQAEDQARSSVASYTSRRAILRKSLPMIFLGAVLAAVELLIIGALYTLVSLLIYMPLLYFYTKSVRPVRGKYLGEVSHSGGHMKINRYLVPDELFELIDFGKPIAPATIEINGHEGYLATKVKKLDNGTIYAADLAWIHFNLLKFATEAEVLEKAVEFATNLELENAELDKLKTFESVLEGKRQKKEQLDLIDKAYRENPMELHRRIEEQQRRIDMLVRQNESLLYGPKDEKLEKEVEE
jgi:tetratricopeptide (TPR) repeat protein